MRPGLDRLPPHADRYERAREFVEKLRAVSQAPVIYAEIPYAQHAFDIFGSARGHYTASAVERFLDWARATRPE